MPTALVTGPTSGIGRGFAEEFARRGLGELSRELLSSYGVRSEVLPADLSVRADVDAVARRLADPSAPITALVNNAGFGLRTTFLRGDVEDEQRAIDVMVSAVMRLTHAAAGPMVERGNGMIINVSSVASWITGGTYSAAKAYVTVFTESLAQELAGTGVRAVAVCPGFVHTEFHERADIDMSGLPDALWLEVPRVVDQAMRDLAVGRSVSVAGMQYKAVSQVLRHGPRSVARIATSFRGRNPRFGARV
jgi:short-subunit dehydrogenase